MQTLAPSPPIATSAHKAEITQDSFGLLLHVVKNMRAADRREIYATQWHDDDEAFAASILHQKEQGGVGWVFGRDGEPIAAIGAMQMWPMVWSGWMFATDKFPLVGLALTKFVKNIMLPGLVSSGEFHRAQAFSIEGHSQAHAWLKTLGAVEEAVIPNFGRNRESFHLFAWNY